MKFNDIVGNENAKQILIKSLKNNAILHSYMFIGNEGIGKKIIANQFAKMVLCNNYNFEENAECNRCKSCIEFEGNNNPDYIQIEPDGKTIKIEQIRQMQSKIIEKTVNLNKKVYIIDDADLMTKEAQNCLLKTLEEPPSYITIILIVSNENRILNTIKSRCMKINFEKIQDSEIEKFLTEQCEMQNINKNILRMCDGSIGRCLLIKNKIYDYGVIENLLKSVKENIIKFLNNAEILYKNKDNIYDYLDYINVILYQHANDEIYNNMKYINSIKIVEQTKQKLISSCNYDMCIDYLLFNIWEEINEKYNWR